MMQPMPNNPTTVINQLMTAWNAHDLDALVALYTPDYEGIDVARPMPYQGVEGARASLEHYLQAFPDLQFTPEDILIQGDCAVLVWKAEGTHQGVLMNIPVTHRKVAVKGVSVLTLYEGKIARGLYIWDVAGMLRGLGLLPDL